MTDKTITVTLTEQQIEDIMAAANAASVYFREEGVRLSKLTIYEMGEETLRRIHGCELLTASCSKLWVQFYQHAKVVRKGGAA